jgi:Membrane iron-sulfur containing protein FtrD-like
LGRKSREKQEKLAFRARQQSRQQVNYIPQVTKKKGLSNAKKILIGLTLIAVMVVAASVALSQSPQTYQLQQTQGSSYPVNVAPVAYTTPTLSSDGNKVTIPASLVNSSKLVFVDLKLQTPTETLEYQGRTVPLAIYRNGEYLPLVIISTPSGNTVAGVRTCEPCGSFSFHIVKGTNLQCDSCGTEWTLENFAPVSGGCLSYPPPKVTSTTNGDNLEIDLSALNVQLASA